MAVRIFESLRVRIELLCSIGLWSVRTQGSVLYGCKVYQRYIHGGKMGRKLADYTNSEHPSIWLDIVREVKKLKCIGTDLLGFIQKNLGNGSATSFWEVMLEVELNRRQLSHPGSKTFEGVSWSLM
ncbi:hypothetical protein Tco_0656639 [Tanacetum coccineum]|uniref:Uncharacterized protein n=1 Tax=Tanacetum coccineum TaxID=301880 RepID=A0ABQ4XAG9_9ASTR